MHFMSVQLQIITSHHHAMSRIWPIIWIQVTKTSLLWFSNHAEKTQNHRGAQRSFQWDSNLSDLVQTGVTAARPDQTRHLAGHMSG